MKLYVNGCSFSHGHKDFQIKNGESDISPDWVWPMLMNDSFDEVISEAYRGSSNHRIIRRSMEYLANIKQPEDWTVVIQFANFQRQEYYDINLKSWIGHVVNDPCLDDRAPTIGNFYLENKLEYKTFKNYCTFVNNGDSIITDIIIDVLAFQHFCKIKGFKKVFYTGQSSGTLLPYYFGGPDALPFRVDYELQQYETIKKLYQNIDTSNFLLPISHVTRGHEESETDGHPNEAGHKLFARYIINEIEKKYE